MERKNGKQDLVGDLRPSSTRKGRRSKPEQQNPKSMLIEKKDDDIAMAIREGFPGHLQDFVYAVQEGVLWTEWASYPVLMWLTQMW